jgi:hypothetical protein
VYDRHSYDAEMRAAVSWWDRELRRATLPIDRDAVAAFCRRCQITRLALFGSVLPARSALPTKMGISP